MFFFRVFFSTHRPNQCSFPLSLARRFYLPFAENALRYFFALGFVPWRLRKLSTGDVVPEVIPLGLFTWSIESMPNRVPRTAASGGGNEKGGSSSSGQFSGRDGAAARASSAQQQQQLQKQQKDKHQMAAEQAFKKQKAYFSDPKRVPYPLQGDVMRMGNRSDESKKAEKDRLKGFGEELRKQSVQDGKTGPAEGSTGEPDSFPEGKNKRKAADANTPAFYRQRAALARQSNAPPDDDDTKMLRCAA